MKFFQQNFAGKKSPKNNFCIFYRNSRQLVLIREAEITPNLKNRNEQKTMKMVAAIEFINDPKTLIEVLQKTEIDVEDEHFTDILMIIFLTKNHEVFGEWLKHLCRKHSIHFINGELQKSYKTSLLALCTRSTEHFKKVCELFDGEERAHLFDADDIGGLNCFTHACFYDNFEVVQMLIKQYHYDWISKDLDGDTVINILAQEGNLRILKYLLSVSSDTTEQHRNLALESSRVLNEKGWSFLSQICSKGHYRILKYFMKGEEKSLMQQVFPFANYSRHYIDCLILALTSDKQSNLVYNCLLSFVEEKITDSQINLDYSPLISSDGQNILMASVNCSDTLMSLLNIAEAQSNKSELLSQKDSNGNNCLRWACLYGSLDSVKLLLDYDQTDWKSDTYHNGKTLLHDLFDLGSSQILEYIYFKFNPDFLDLVKRLDGSGYSCLYYACSAAKSIECITLLVEVLDIILPLQIPENVSHFMACLMAAKKSKSDNKDEILELLVKCFNEKTSTRCGDWEDVCRVYREKTADLDLD